MNFVKQGCCLCLGPMYLEREMMIIIYGGSDIYLESSVCELHNCLHWRMSWIFKIRVFLDSLKSFSDISKFTFKYSSGFQKSLACERMMAFLRMTMTRWPVDMRTAVELRWGNSCCPAPLSLLSPRSFCNNFLRAYFSWLGSPHRFSFDFSLVIFRVHFLHICNWVYNYIGDK